jgi:hypothetical protein
VYLVGSASCPGKGSIRRSTSSKRPTLIPVSGGVAAVRSGERVPGSRPGVERIRNIVLTKGIKGVPPAFVDEYDLRIFRVRKLREMVRAAGFRIETV